MTKEEALIYLPTDEEGDLQDVYEEKLFELKQFFLNRFPVSKLINGRLAKFQKVEEAFETLGGVVAIDKEVNRVDWPEFSSISDLYSWYNREKSFLRLRLSASQSYSEVKQTLNEYVHVTKHYAKYWLVPVDEKDSAALKIGVEPDAMMIQHALNELSNLEKIDSEYILSLPDENSLKSEAKRLSLWLNFESNE